MVWMQYVHYFFEVSLYIYGNLSLQIYQSQLNTHIIVTHMYNSIHGDLYETSTDDLQYLDNFGKHVSGWNVHYDAFFLIT